MHTILTIGRITYLNDKAYADYTLENAEDLSVNETIAWAEQIASKPKKEVTDGSNNE